MSKPLDISCSLDVTTLTDIVDLVVLEGCVGETSAALEREPRSVKQRILEVRRSAPIQHSSARDVVLPCLDALLDLARVSPTQELFT